MKFLHMADLHLGAPARGFVGLAPEWAARLQRAIPEAYDRAIDAAIAHAVDFVVIAGDVFDTSKPSYGDYLRFFEGLEKLDAAGIPSYLVAGNHDPYTAWARDVERLPESAHLLGVDGPEFALFSRESAPECLIAGRSYHNQAWPADQSIADGITRAAAAEALGTDAPFAIGIIHTGLDIDIAKAPADQAELMAAGIDYWACGHFHQPIVRPTPGNPRVVFPGCLQARDIKETGERGCYLVELERNAPPSLEFIPTSSVVFQQLEVDVGACQTLADLVHLVQARLFRENGLVHCDAMVVRARHADRRDRAARFPAEARHRARAAQPHQRRLSRLLLRRARRAHDAGRRRRKQSVSPGRTRNRRRRSRARNGAHQLRAKRARETRNRGAVLAVAPRRRIQRDRRGARARPAARRRRRMTRRYLQHIYVERYGALADCEVGPLEPGMNVVLGPNEAGKSTASSLVGGVLFGWEDAHGVRNTYRPPEGDRAGRLQWDAPPGELRRDEDGATGDASVVADIDRATFDTLFALTADELRSLRGSSDVTARLLSARLITSTPHVIFSG